MEASHLTYSAIPAVVVLLPAAAALLVRPIGRRSETARDWFAAFVTAATFLGSLALIPAIAKDHAIGCRIPLLLRDITFEVDPFAMFFALFTSFVWMASTIYAGAYMKHEERRDRYFTFNLAVLAANMGVVLAGDLVTLYLFFEMLGLLAYMMVVHTQTAEAKAASVKYLWMTVIGGFMLVAGILLVYALGSEGAIGPVPTLEAGSEALKWSAAILLVFGFGVKAGILPVHVWLPDAHPVAPSPASALLSGIMIKAGAYGIFRVVTALFRPEVAEHIDEELWHFSSQLGFVVIWIGIATMFVGVVLALLQENAKRMLAYHSVSQMGFIITGIGCAGYLAAHGAMGYAGGLYHIVNHALFKACLFLGVGAVYFRTHELNMYKLGGLWKKMPLTFLFTLVAAAGITGVPVFNGFVSKTLIHHAIVESVEHAAHYYTAAQASSLQVAEIIFIVTCGGTACSFIKLIKFVFLGKSQQDLSGVREVPVRMLAAMGLLAVPIVALGLVPDLMLKGIVAPGLHLWGLHADTIEHFTLFAGENLLSVVYAFAIGTVVFVVGVKTGAFHAHFPWWMSVDSWYRLGARGLVASFDATAIAYDSYLQRVSRLLARWQRDVSRAAERGLRRWHRLVTTLSTGAPLLRHQQFMDSAFVLLERERHETVREAVSAAVDRLRTREELGDADRQAIIDSVRDVSTYMATRLFNERIGVLSGMVRAGRVEPVGVALEQVIEEVRAFRQPVADTALRYAEPRTRGENVVRAISHEMNVIMSAERFDLRMRQAIPVWSGSATAAELGQSTRQSLQDAAALTAFRAEGLTRLEAAGRWLSDLSRTTAEFVIRERIPWMIEEHLDRRGVVALQLAVQRYVRDISLNVGVIVVVFLVFVIAVMFD